MVRLIDLYYFRYCYHGLLQTTSQETSRDFNYGLTILPSTLLAGRGCPGYPAAMSMFHNASGKYVIRIDLANQAF
ncbi:MAG: hypothetical protein AAGF93_14425 [Cyanobacteria bacterium P01_H01_bin.105]